MVERHLNCTNISLFGLVLMRCEECRKSFLKQKYAGILDDYLILTFIFIRITAENSDLQRNKRQTGHSFSLCFIIVCYVRTVCLLQNEIVLRFFLLLLIHDFLCPQINAGNFSRNFIIGTMYASKNRIMNLFFPSQQK